MSILEFAIKFFQDSGVAIYFSIAIMAVGMSIAIERYVFLNRARAQNRKLWAQVLPMLQNGKFTPVGDVGQHAGWQGEQEHRQKNRSLYQRGQKR